MNKLISYLNQGNEVKALDEFAKQWAEFPWISRYFAILFPVAASCLELRYKNSHVLKYHHSLWKICENMPGEYSEFFLRRYVQFLSAKERFKAVENGDEPVGILQAETIRENLFKSIEDKAFSNGLFYALEMKLTEGYESAGYELIKLCADEVDNLGHAFTCAHGILEAGRVSGRNCEAQALKALLDFTFAHTLKTPSGKFLEPQKPFSSNLKDSLHSPGLLGHNLIFAHRISIFTALDDDPEFRLHLEHFLENNIIQGGRKYPDDFPKTCYSGKNVDKDSLSGIFRNILDDSLSGIVSNLADYLSNGGDVEALFNGCMAILACVNKMEPHYYTYALAVKELSGKYPDFSEALYAGWIDFIMENVRTFGLIVDSEKVLRALGIIE